ncbi:MAG: rhodanese-like domain-containing protein [Cryomorphaceae bacterium]|nr:rhodanese-like domain-containing protein [Flavobacteriales bacterium]
MSIFSIFSKSETDLSPSEFKEKLDGDKNAYLLDVRTSGEFKGGAIKGAKNLDFFSKNFKAELENLPSDKNYYVYCRSGNRSGQAVKALKSKGCTAYNLDGGIMAWPY